MNCDEFDRQLQAMIENRTVSCDDRSREHASECERCRHEWEETQFLDEVISRWKSDVPEIDLAQAILARMASDSQPEETRRDSAESARRVLVSMKRGGVLKTRLRSGKAVAAVSAVALVLVFFVTVWSPSPRTIDRDATTAHSEYAASHDLHPHGQGYKELQSLVQETQSTYLALTNGATQVVPEWFAKISAIHRVSSPPQTDETGSTWAEEFRQNFEPIGQDVNKAIDFLFQTISVPTT